MRRRKHTKRKAPKQTKRPKRKSPKRTKRAKHSKKYTKKRVKRNLRRNYSIYIGGNPLEAEDMVARTSDESTEEASTEKVAVETIKEVEQSSPTPRTGALEKESTIPESWVHLGIHKDQIVVGINYYKTLHSHERWLDVNPGDKFINTTPATAVGLKFLNVINEKGQAGMIPYWCVIRMDLYNEDMKYMLTDRGLPVQHINPLSCRWAHYKKMGLDPKTIVMLLSYNSQGIRPNNIDLEKLYDRNKDMGVSFNRLNQKLQENPVVVLEAHGSTRSMADPINLREEFDAHIINFTQSGSSFTASFTYDNQIRQTDEGELTNMNNDLFNFLQHIVGNQDISPGDMAKYHFFKPGEQLSDGSGPEVKRNFHYLPLCYEESIEIKNLREKFYLITSDGSFHKENVFRNLYSWKNPKVYGEGKASRIINHNLSLPSNETFCGFKDHTGPREGLLVRSNTTKPGFYIFNYSLNSDDDINELMKCLHEKSTFYNDQGSSFKDQVSYTWELASIDGLDYIYIYTTCTDPTYNTLEGSRYYISTITYKDMLTCFKGYFKSPFTTIDTICRSSNNKIIGDETSDMARMISTETTTPGGRPHNATYKDFVYLTIKAPKQLVKGDSLAIMHVQPNQFDWVAHAANGFISTTLVYPIIITDDHIPGGNTTGVDYISPGQKFDVKIGTYPTYMDDWLRRVAKEELPPPPSREARYVKWPSKPRNPREARHKRYPSRPRNPSEARYVKWPSKPRNLHRDIKFVA